MSRLQNSCNAIATQLSVTSGSFALNLPNITVGVHVYTPPGCIPFIPLGKMFYIKKNTPRILFLDRTTWEGHELMGKCMKNIQLLPTCQGDYHVFLWILFYQINSFLMKLEYMVSNLCYKAPSMLSV